jgi:N-acetylmuramic acid 6-phosphate etherase
MSTQDESSRRASSLESERVNAATLDIDRLSPLEIAQLMNAEDARVASAVAETLPQIGLAIERIATRMRQGGRMIYVGAGTSGRLGALDAVECPPTFNVSPDLIVSRIAGGTFAWTTATEDAEDRADLGESDMAALDVRAYDRWRRRR